MKCQYCGESVDLPFRCQFCGGYFCGNHRLPENHACPEIQRVISLRKEERAHAPAKMSASPAGTQEYIYVPASRVKPKRSSPKEVLHLSVGALVVLAVGFSYIFQPEFLTPQGIWLWNGAALAFTAIFMLHELAHKAVAMHNGLWAEFRLSRLGLLITALSIVLPMKFISPGAVVISGEANKKTIGLTAFAGPFTNLVLSPVFFGLYFLVSNYAVSFIMLSGAWLSSWIALINLIPYGIMDGAKIMWWNKKVWAVSFVAAVALTLATIIVWANSP